MKIHHFDGIYQEKWGFSWATLVSGRVPWSIERLWDTKYCCEGLQRCCQRSRCACAGVMQTKSPGWVTNRRGQALLMNQALPEFEIEPENHGLMLEEGNILWQCVMFGFHIKLQGCSGNKIQNKFLLQVSLEIRILVSNDWVLLALRDWDFLSCWVRKLLLRAVQTFTRFVSSIWAADWCCQRCIVWISCWIISWLMLISTKKVRTLREIDTVHCNFLWLRRAGKCNRKFCKCQLP